MGHTDKNANNPADSHFNALRPSALKPLSGEDAGQAQPPRRAPLRAGLAFEDVHAKLAHGLHMKDSGQRILAFYLSDMETRRLHQVGGFSSTTHYAEARLGLDRRRTRELVSVGKKLLLLPAIDAAFAAGLIGWAKLLCLVRVASPEHEMAWLKKALELSCRKLRLEVRLSREGEAPRKPGERTGLPTVRFPISMSLDPLGHRAFDLAQQKLSAERGRPVDAAECVGVLAKLFLQLEEDGSVKGRTRVPASLYRIVLREDPASGLREDPVSGLREDPVSEATSSPELLVDTDLGAVPIEDRSGIRCDAEWVTASGEHVAKDVPTPTALRLRVLARDGHQCRCCRSRMDLMVHHIKPRGEGGRTRAWNLITLCARCHALVHADLLVLEGGREGRIRFADARKAALEAGPRAERSALGTLEEALEEALLEPAIVPAAEPEPAPMPVGKDEAFAGLVGQELLLDRLEVAALASRGREVPFPHTLFVGPPGTGKTTLARGIAKLAGARVHETCGPHVSSTQALADLLAPLQTGDILFIDEVHAVPRPVLEVLYGAMDRNRTDSKGAGHAGPFTLVAATTEEAELPDALRSRFGLLESLAYYSESDLAALAQHNASSQGVTLKRRAAACLARAARGTPRELLRLLERALDEASLRGATRITRSAAVRALTRMGIDACGLHPNEQRYLELLRRDRRPVPLHRLARLLGLPERTLRVHIEPFLFARGLVHTTRQGRAILGS